MPELQVHNAAYRAGESALQGYPLAQSDMLDAASDVINAALPEILRSIADYFWGETAERDDLLDELRARADELEDGAA